MIISCFTTRGYIYIGNKHTCCVTWDMWSLTRNVLYCEVRINWFEPFVCRESQSIIVWWLFIADQNVLILLSMQVFEVGVALYQNAKYRGRDRGQEILKRMELLLFVSIIGSEHAKALRSELVLCTNILNVKVDNATNVGRMILKRPSSISMNGFSNTAVVRIPFTFCIWSPRIMRCSVIWVGDNYNEAKCNFIFENFTKLQWEEHWYSVKI